MARKERNTVKTNAETLTSEQVDAAEQLAREDAAAGREPLWYRCGESYVSAESGHVGNTELGAAYVAAYAEARRDV